MIFKNTAISLLFTIALLSCMATGENNKEVTGAARYIEQCQQFIETDTSGRLPDEANFAYVMIFNKGTMVSFTREAVGTFGKRSEDYRQYWVCGFTDEGLSYVRATLSDPILDLPGGSAIEDYDGNVKELLFKKVDGEFGYCCSQPFDADNLEKHNPALYKKSDVLPVG